MEVCVICGKPSECTHHLIFGNSRRRLSDFDDLTISMCNEHHNMAVKAVDRIHGNNTAQILSKMLGQAIWENKQLAHRCFLSGDDEASERTRQEFVDRYGRSYL